MVIKKKPRLTPKQRKDRLNFAISHQHWTVDDWKRAIWTDKTKINRFGSDRQYWAYKKVGENDLVDREVKETLKFDGGSLMMWGCITWDRPGYATRINGRMNSDLYLTILKKELQQSLEFYSLDSSNIIFQ